MSKLEKTVGLRLRAVMKEFDIVGNKALGEICGTNASVVNNWLSGYNLPRVPEIMLLKRATGVSLDWLYDGDVGGLDPKVGIALAKRVDILSQSE